MAANRGDEEGAGKLRSRPCMEARPQGECEARHQDVGEKRRRIRRSKPKLNASLQIIVQAASSRFGRAYQAIVLLAELVLSAPLLAVSAVPCRLD